MGSEEVILFLREKANIVGVQVTGFTEKLLSWFISMGFLTSPLTAKIITLLIIMGAFLLIVKFFNFIAKPIRITFFVILILLFVSVISTVR